MKVRDSGSIQVYQSREAALVGLEAGRNASLAQKSVTHRDRPRNLQPEGRNGLTNVRKPYLSVPMCEPRNRRHPHRFTVSGRVLYRNRSGKLQASKGLAD